MRILFAAAALIGAATIFATHYRPTSDATLTATSLTPGRPTSLVSLASAGRVPAHATPPLEADVGSLEVADLTPSRRSLLAAGTFDLAIGIGRFDCRRLASRLGGGCGPHALPPKGSLERLAVETSASSSPFLAWIYPTGAERIEITDTTTDADPRLDTAWWFRDDAPHTGIELHCPRPTRLLIVAPPMRAEPVCASHGVTYRLALSLPRPRAATVFLNGVERLEAHLAGRDAYVGLDEGSLSVAGALTTSVAHPTAVALHAATGQVFRLALEGPSGRTRLGVSGDAASVTLDGSERVGDWLDRNQTAFYTFLAVVLTLMVPPLYLFGRRA